MEATKLPVEGACSGPARVSRTTAPAAERVRTEVRHHAEDGRRARPQPRGQAQRLGAAPRLAHQDDDVDAVREARPAR